MTDAFEKPVDGTSSQFMLDPKMWLDAPYGGCDAIVELWGHAVAN
jgi:hypothetical protein